VRERLAQFMPRCDAALDGEASKLLVRRAAAWSIEAHVGGVNQTDVPYLHHVLDVAEQVGAWYGFADAEVLAAALLHDALEDAPQVLAAHAAERTASVQHDATSAMRDHLSPRVAELVSALTNPSFPEILGQRGLVKNTPAYDAMMLCSYTEHFVELFTDAPPAAAVIKLSDFLANAGKLDNLLSRPATHRWLVRKYGPCIAFLHEHLPGLRERGAEPTRRAIEHCLPVLEQAWSRHCYSLPSS
jgi:(p)ppGpp synthase/HD superfamily hydrolase